MIETIGLAILFSVKAGGSSLPLSDIASVAAAVFAGLALLGTAYYGFIRGKGKEGQTQAKDDIIETYQQSVDALEVRISTLENELKRVGQLAKDQANQISDLQTQVAVAEARYEELKKYAAPDAVVRIEEKLTTMATALDALDKKTPQRSG